MPRAEEMERITAKDEAYYLGPFYKSARHTIQVDFGHYCSDLKREIERGPNHTLYRRRPRRHTVERHEHRADMGSALPTWK